MLMHTTRMAAAFLLTAGLSLPAIAQEGAPAEAETSVAADLPDGFDILDRHVEAIGGKDAAMKLEGVRMTGSLAVPAMGMTGSIVVSAAPPAKQILDISINGFGTMVQGINGDKAWASQPGGEPMMMPEAQAKPMIENAQFYDRYQPRKRYQSATTTGTETMDGEEVYVVELVSTGGTESVGFYSVETGLQRAEKSRAVPGAAAFDSEIVYLDYKEHDGLKFASVMKMVQQGFAQEITFESIEINPEFDTGTFDAPGDL
ncbi:MAG: hypothetical protein AAFZ67_00980 [Planctomycetota bacterium]